MPPAASSSTSSDPRLSVSADGALIAHVEDDRIALLDGESLTVSGEIGIDPEAEGCDVVLCGDPLRLVVLSRYPSGGRLHVIDPAGPTAVGELALRTPMRLAAASGDHIWLQAAAGSSLVDVVHKDLVLSPLALRAPVNAVGAFVSGRFVVSTGGMIEEWDGENRAPARRFRLARPTAAQVVGGGARQVWMVPIDGDRIDVVPLINVGQQTRIELPEPVARIAADASHESLIALGARTGTAYLIDLSGKTPPAPIDGVSGTDVVWLGPNPSVVVVSPGQDIEVIPVSGRTRTGLPLDRAGAPPVRLAAPPRSSMLTAPSGAVVGAPASAPTGSGAIRVPTPAATAGARAGSGAVTMASTARGAATGRGAPAAVPAPDGSIADKLVAWRERIRTAAPRPAPAPSTGWFTPPAPPSWRDHLARWAQSVISGTRADPPTIGEGPAALVAERLGLSGELAEALWLVYGAHLAGVDGVSAVDLIQVIDRRWDEALGQGRLAASGALRWRRSRIGLRRVVVAALDEAPPVTGAWIESVAEPPDQIVAVVAAGDVDLAALARWIAPEIGPLLVGGEAHPVEQQVLEAKVRGGLAVLRWPPLGARGATPPTALLVVADEAAARTAGAPVLATWPPR
jgi:hypothetical protein